jgi:hypothetical protein
MSNSLSALFTTQDARTVPPASARSAFTDGRQTAVRALYLFGQLQ